MNGVNAVLSHVRSWKDVPESEKCQGKENKGSIASVNST